jgi:hypothetical protein
METGLNDKKEQTHKKDILGWYKPVTSSLIALLLCLMINGKRFDAYIPMTAAQIDTVLGYVPMNAANIVLTTTGTSGASTYNPSSASFNIPQYSGGTTYTAGNGIGIASNVISVVQPTISTPTRTLNTAFTISTTKAATVCYTVALSVTNPLILGTSTATSTLQYSTNGGSTWVNVCQASASSGVGVTVTIALTQGQTSTLFGVLPANSLVKIVSATTGTASVTLNSAQETVY